MRERADIQKTRILCLQRGTFDNKWTWFGLLKKTEYTKFCRVKIDITNEKDTDWKIDIKK